MKYNKSYDNEDFENYVAYLDTIKGNLKKKLFDFVSNPDRHNFSRESLHDSWVKSFECHNDFETKNTDIVFTLTGGYFDREFRLCFQGVSQYEITQRMSEIYRDLITYEVGIEMDDDGEEKLIFRALFSGDNEIEIYSEHIDFEEILIDK